MTSKFGLSVALATPFSENGNIAIEAMVAQARRCLAAGCSSVTLFGTTGEGPSIGNGERERVLAAFLDAGIAPRNIIVGVLVDAAEDAAMQASQALSLGARNILLAPPSYFKNVSDDGVFQWFSAVFALLGDKARDIIVYNLPSVTMVPLSVSLIGRLRTAFPHVVMGVKDSSGDWPYTEALLKAHSDLIILVGDERHLAKAVRLGGRGAISGMANFVPRELKPMAEEGRDDARVEDFVVELLKHPVISAVKAMVARTTSEETWIAVRPPLIPISGEAQGQLALAFDRLFSSKAA
ncbi:dihydrodipicolinate synthase family protein [Rhizobium bangladeshense]|uniref:dihydrodipicolinate synthase family protein n=1 Tax=Rhizobium bangladeshense TaxID=1138189 RepID=UPI001A98C8F1|nr:dihydrodipicolinate synthase family protein [Rhizobium bangladeshense]MBX4867224.1 dihydrodipicolinate synthase family protein [Rhizobium bangladeshense]MBX4897002.1 dihydrodipicolinate synthase family protein [Rhizobium bangladeshense]MBX4900959.1 dihydrodipicolinate synthase family protein [Rhizobium bangladeshense]MBX4915667.1 dihydrodipicolinate synthase family protein [Rhizobium bangladeshense]MBX4920531.1 dihydrodipicolinate synthase family protein [Rhizobium bangladeshense]